MSIRWYDSARSSFDLLSPDAAHGCCVAVRRQLAGRGQRGNSWESAPGANLTFSLLLRPRAVTPPRQYELSMSVATSVCRVLRRYVPRPDLLRLKWPNDIYYGDRKLGGILIEQVLSGRGIERSAVGIGINVNQHCFVSDAPNPVSLYQITGREHDLEPLLAELHHAIVTDFDTYEDGCLHTAQPDAQPCSGTLRVPCNGQAILTEDRKSPSPDARHAERAATRLRNRLLQTYRSMLWRGEGLHPYRDAATGQLFEARIADILPHGPIVLQLNDNTTRTYYFKEVQAVL